MGAVSVETFIQNLRFKKKLFGGCDEEDVLLKMQQLGELFHREAGPDEEELKERIKNQGKKLVDLDGQLSVERRAKEALEAKLKEMEEARPHEIRELQSQLDECRRKQEEQARDLEESHRKQREQTWALEESQQKQEDQTRILEESQRKQREQAHALEESRKKQEEQARALEESRQKQEEQARALEESRQKQEEQARALEDARQKQEEQARALEESRQKQEEQARALEESRRKQEEQVHTMALLQSQGESIRQQEQTQEIRALRARLEQVAPPRDMQTAVDMNDYSEKVRELNSLLLSLQVSREEITRAATSQATQEANRLREEARQLEQRNAGMKDQVCRGGQRILDWLEQMQLQLETMRKTVEQFRAGYGPKE